MTNTAFDALSGDYDTLFTRTPVIRFLRNNILEYVENRIIRGRKLRILELNCGTGEDAVYFGSRGHEVLATDISEGMIAVAREKAEQAGIRGIEFRCLSFQDFPREELTGKFDLVFSNFSGLNCLDPSGMEKLFGAVDSMLKENGHFAGVVMPRYFLWEMIYFTLKGRRDKAFRRKGKEGLIIPLKGGPVPTWFYSPVEIRRMIRGSNFKLNAVRPAGFALPSPGLYPLFAKHLFILGMLKRSEDLFRNCSLAANFSDHFLFDLEKRNI